MIFKADQSTCLTSLALRVQFLEPKKGERKNSYPPPSTHVLRPCAHLTYMFMV